MFSLACEQRGVSITRRRIEENLELKVQHLVETREHAVTSFGWILSLVLGLAGARDLGSGLVGPLWRVAGLPIPSEVYQEELLHTSLAVTLIFLLALMTWWFTIGRNKRH